ncbi:MAG: winged helix-turn-helix domain-containing tetratricopeptide repeat protein [Acidiferrobacterales bacterium]
MSEASLSTTPFYIDQWYVDPSTGRIRSGDQETRVEPRVMALLCYLADRPGQVIAREELEGEVWTGMVVGYDALTSAIIKLRKAFDDDSRKPRIIETVSKRGYRLIAPVRSVGDAGEAGEGAAPAFSRTFKPRFWMGGGVLVLLLAALLGYRAYHGVDLPPAPLPDKPTLVVLPFTNLGDHKKDDYFSDGITEDIATDLSQYSGINLIARYSAEFYRQQKPSFPAIHNELGVDYVIAGSVRRSHKAIRVNVQLIDAVTGKQLWAERFDSEMQQLFHVQDKIRGKVIEALAVPLTKEEKRFAARRYTRSVEAYNAFLLARASYGRHTREGSEQARQYLETAIAIDPEFARAYDLMALTYVDDFRYAWNVGDVDPVRAAEQAAKKALELDDRIPQAHWVLGYIDLFGLKKHDAAIEQGLKAIRLDPNLADGHTLLAVTYLYKGQPRMTVRYVAEAMRLNPHYPSQYPAVMGYAHYFMGEWEEAEKYLKQAIEMNPGRMPPNVYLIASQSARGDLDDAKWNMENLRFLDQSFNIDEWAVRQPFATKALLNKVITDLHRAEQS